MQNLKKHHVQTHTQQYFGLIVPDLAHRGESDRWLRLRELLANRSARRWIALVASILAFAWLAPNIAIKSGIVESFVNAHARGVTLTLQGAWSPWPGRVHADRVELVIDGSDLDVHVDLHDVRADLSLLKLAQRHVKLEHVQGRGGRVVLRAGDPSPELQKAQAEIPHARAKTKPGEAYPPLEDPALLEVNDLDLTLDELWLDALRVRGRAEIAGSFRYRPGRFLEIPRASIDVESNNVTVGAERLADAAQLELRVRVGHIDVSRDAWGLVDELSGTIAGHGRVAQLSGLTVYLPVGLRAPSGSGEVALRIALHRGALVAPSRVGFVSKQLRGKHEGLSAEATLRAGISVDDARAARVQLELPRFSVDYHGQARGQGARLWWQLRSTRLRDALGVGELHAALPEMDYQAVRIDHGEVHATAQRLQLSGTFDRWSHEHMSATAELTGKAVNVYREGFGVHTNLGASAAVALRRDVVSGKLALNFKDASIQDGATRVKDIEGFFELPRFSYQLKARCLAGKTNVRIAESGPIAKLLGVSGILRTLAPSGPARAAGKVMITPAGWSVDVDRVDVDGKMQIRGGLTMQKQLHGAFLVNTPLLNVGVRLAGGERNISLFSNSVPDVARPKLRCDVRQN